MNDARLVGSSVPEVSAHFSIVFWPVASCHVRVFLPFYSALQYWQWPGDVEALVVDLTHRVSVCSVLLPHLISLLLSFFVEIFDFDPKASNSPHFLSPSAAYAAEFRISACVYACPLSSSVISLLHPRYIFDESNSTIDSFTPMKSLPQWDKRIRCAAKQVFPIFSHIIAAGNKKWTMVTACLHRD
jgi:hypothetical protein